MKLKTRLIVAFCFVIFLPIVLFFAVLFGFYQLQVHSLKQNYGMEEDAGSFIFMNNIQMLDRYTSSEFDAIQKIAQETPDQLEDHSYLKKYNQGLNDKDSFLVVSKDGKIVFNGAGDQGYEDSEIEEMLPEYGSEQDDSSEDGYYLDQRMKVMIKQINFSDSTGGIGRLYLVTSTDSVIPEVRQLLIDIGLSVVIVLVLTAAVMTIWIYKGIINPIARLKVATQNIRDGNLDFTIDVESDDEIGELCRNFEQMRQKLKESTEENIAAEKENRVLISNIAHDLKTPITTVKGYAEGLIDGVAATPEKRDRYIRTIYNKANEMDRLINELTLYSQIDTNRIPYNFKKITVADYFTDCIEEIGLDLEAREIGLAYYNYADEKTVIIADPEQLKRVINNIISNSVKYMNKPKGFINIRIKDVGDFIQVEIEDNGCGIPTREIPYIFDRFYRTDASRNSRTGGSGIGLSIVKKIIEDHGGKIWATSKENTGTIMYFVIRKYQEVSNE